MECLLSVFTETKHINTTFDTLTYWSVLGLLSFDQSDWSIYKQCPKHFQEYVYGFFEHFRSWTLEKNWCWGWVKWTLRNKVQWHLKHNAKQIVQENAFEKYRPVTMTVPASGHQVRCIPWVRMGTFNKEIGFLCGLKFFALNIFCGEYLQSSLHLMLQIWWKPLQWKMCQWIMMCF